MSVVNAAGISELELLFFYVMPDDIASPSSVVEYLFSVPFILFMFEKYGNCA